MSDLKLESSIKSLSDYLIFCEDNYFVEFWIGGKLRPFDLSRSQYRWVVFPHDLSPGVYRLCLMLTLSQAARPMRAYGVAFAPGEKVPAKVNTTRLGYGFNMTPAIASGNSFYSDSNITEFRTRFCGAHQLGVTTQNWSTEAENTAFELLLLRNKKIQYISTIPSR